MRKQILALLSLGGLSLLVTMSCSLAPLVPWLTPTPTPTPKVRDFELRELLIDISALSSLCHLDGPPKELPYEEKPVNVEEDLYIRFDCNGSLVGGMYAVYRFRDSQAAAERYRNLPGWFYNATRITPYKVPDWVQYQSPVADQFRFACADFHGYTEVYSRRCVVIGQYEEYISAFSISISPPESMIDHTMLLKQILQAIDERMTLHLRD